MRLICSTGFLLFTLIIAPVTANAEEEAVTAAQEPEATNTEEPVAANTEEPVAANAEEPVVANTEEPVAANAPVSDRNGFSLGIILGDPTGLTLRAGFGESNAIQAHVGFSPFPGDAVAVMVDWTYDVWVFLRDNATASLPFFFGFGGKAEWFSGNYYAYHDHRDYADQSHFGFGARGLVGFRASFVNVPLDLFIELAPVGFLVIVPDTGAYYDVDFAIGLRYRF